jgi:hypothetical protein
MPPPRDDLHSVAERFDALYTDLTVLQRLLVAAVRNGDRSAAVLEAVQRAEILLAAAHAADTGMARRRPSPKDVETAALRTRLLHRPVDAVVLLAVLRSLRRSQALPLLTEALRMDSEDGADSELGRYAVVELLAAPRSMSDDTGRRLAAHFGIEPRSPVGALSAVELDRLWVPGLRNALTASRTAWRIGAVVNPVRRRTDWGQADLSWTPGSTVSRAGSPTPRRHPPTKRPHAMGGPADAVDVAEALFQFTERQLVSEAVPDWDRLQAIDDDDDERTRALRAKQSGLRKRLHEDDAAWLYVVVDRYIAADRSTRKARQLAVADPETWGSSNPMGLARTTARRCGEILALFDPDFPSRC